MPLRLATPMPTVDSPPSAAVNGHPPRPTRPSRNRNLATVFGGVALVVAGVIFTVLRGGPGCAATVNGVCLNREEVSWYRENQTWLGTVLGRGRVDGLPYVFFTYYAARRTTDGNGESSTPVWTLLDLGRREAVRRGIPLHGDAQAHPAIQQYLADLERVSVPWRERVGMFPLTQVWCIAAGSSGTERTGCVQYWAYAALHLDPQSGVVSLEPLSEQAFKNLLK
jgi:hypothetical protein